MEPDELKEKRLRLAETLKALKPWMDAGAVHLILGAGDEQRVAKEVFDALIGEPQSEEDKCEELVNEACEKGSASATFIEPEVIQEDECEDFLRKLSKATDGKVAIGVDSVPDSSRVCGRCGKELPDGNGNPALCTDCADKYTKREVVKMLGVKTPVLDVKWADGCDPELHEDENGHLVSNNPMYPFWSPDVQKKFWTPKEGEKAEIKVTPPDNVARCIDNAGLEDQFDEGVEYIFEGKEGDFIRVYDKTGELRECFSDRFEVVTADFSKFHMHFKKSRETKANFEVWDDPEEVPSV